MPDRPQTWLDILNQVLHQAPWLGPALAGGVIGLLRRFQRRPGESLAMTAGRAGAHLAQALFAGYLIQGGLVAIGHEAWIGPAAGLFAVMGSAGLDWIEDWAKRRADRRIP